MKQRVIKTPIEVQAAGVDFTKKAKALGVV